MHYGGWQIVLGVITQRTEEKITLRDAKGRQMDIAKEDIDVLSAQAKSMMPELFVA